MPRIANEGPKVDKWAETSGEGSSTFDLCTTCFRRHGEGKPLPSKCQPYKSGEPRGNVCEIDGIDPTDAENDGYRCDVCDKPLHPGNY